ncbi:MAG TPA: hypothetical protein VF157_04770, partial [Chloroflexota bacterium]
HIRVANRAEQDHDAICAEPLGACAGGIAPNFAIKRWEAGLARGLDFATNANGFGWLRLAYEPEMEFF